MSYLEKLKKEYLDAKKEYAEKEQEIEKRIDEIVESGDLSQSEFETLTSNQLDKIASYHHRLHDAETKLSQWYFAELEKNVSSEILERYKLLYRKSEYFRLVVINRVLKINQ